jgi:hypothetical protein
MQADEPAFAAEAKKRDWWNDPFGVFNPDASPMALKVHGFFVGLLFGVIGVVVVAVVSSPEKRAHRVVGAGIGLAIWLPACIALSA